MKKLLVTTLPALLGALFLGTAFAAVNPTAPAETSSGSVGVSVEVGPLVQVTQVKDISLDNWNGGIVASDPNLTKSFCVYSNMSSGAGGKYSIQFNGVTSGNNFWLVNQNNANDVAGYQVVFNGNTLTSGGSGSTIHGQPASQLVNCGGDGNTNATLQIKLTGALNGKTLHSGTYTETLAMLVQPE